jgi:glycosyltransferase involved in cell wall biosynthesis
MPEGKNHYPPVAIVTPVYNGSPYLERTMACVQGQTYPNLVHVVLDNASTDDTPRIIAEAQGGRVAIVTRRNSSVLPQVENWNAAIAMTPPEAAYVKFLCADDLIRADAIERMVGIAEAHPNVHFVTAVDVFDDWIKPAEFDQKDGVYDGREIMQRLLSGAISWFPFPHLFFRVTRDRLNNPFDPATLPAPDADFAMRLLLDGDMGFVNAPLFYTRKHAASATSHMGGSRLFIITGLERVQRYGRHVLAPGEFERICRGALRGLLRHVLAWRVTGQSPMAAQTMQALAELGFKPVMKDYFAAVMTWPYHKLRKTVQARVQRGTSPPIRMTEADFLENMQIGAAGKPRAA